MIYLKLFELTLIIVLITDISGITDHIKQWISSILTKGKFITKDFTLTLLDCSFCQNFWIGLIYIIATKNFSIEHVLFILLCSFMTPVLSGLLYSIRDIVSTLINKITPKE